MQEVSNLITEHFTARLKQENLTRKNDIPNFEKRTNFDEKLVEKILMKKLFADLKMT